MSDFNINEFRKTLNQSPTRDHQEYVSPGQSYNAKRDWRQLGVQRDEGFQAPPWLTHLDLYWHRYLAIGMNILFIMFNLTPQFVPGAGSGTAISPKLVLLFSPLPGLIVWYGLSKFRAQIKDAASIGTLNQRGGVFKIGAGLALSAFLYYEFLGQPEMFRSFPATGRDWLVLGIKCASAMMAGGRVIEWAYHKFMGEDVPMEQS